MVSNKAQPEPLGYSTAFKALKARGLDSGSRVSLLVVHPCRVAQKHELELPSHLIEGTMTGAPGAAVSLLEGLYEQLTGKKYVKADHSC